MRRKTQSRSRPNRLGLAGLGLCLALSLAAGVAHAQAPTNQPPEVVWIRIDSPITAVTADYLVRAVEAAEAADSTLLVSLDTPGGDVGSMQRMAGALLNAEVPTLVWVGPDGAQAASAGTFLVLAAHAAGMAPRTTIGAASPVGPGGEDLPSTVGRKATEDLSAAARSYASRRGETAVAWAERAVRDAASASAIEALDLGIVDAVAASPADFLTAVDGLEVTVAGTDITLATAGAATRELPMTGLEEILIRLLHPAVAVILLTIGVNALLIELSSPGGYLAGAVGVVALALAMYSLGALDANFAGLLVMAVSFALFALEVKAPSGGLLAIAGIGLFVLGGAMLFAGGSFPVPWGMLLATAALAAIGASIIVGAGLRAIRRKPTTGAEALLGARGDVRLDLAPRGVVMVLGERWEAKTVGAEPVPVGTTVEVIGREGRVLTVKPVP